MLLSLPGIGVDAQNSLGELSYLGSLETTGQVAWSSDSRWLLMDRYQPEPRVLRYDANDLSREPCEMQGSIANVLDDSVRTYVDSAAWEWNLADCAQTREIHYTEPSNIETAYPWSFTRQISPKGNCALVINWMNYDRHFTAANMQWVHTRDSTCRGHFWEGYRFKDYLLTNQYLAWVAVDSSNTSAGELLFIAYPSEIQLLLTGVTEIALSLDGQRLAAGTDTGQVQVFDTGSQTLEATWDIGLGGVVDQLEWAGQVLAVRVAQDLGDHQSHTILTFWDTERGEPLAQLPLDSSTAYSQSGILSPQGDFAAMLVSKTGDNTSTLDIVDTADGDTRATLSDLPRTSQALWSPDGERIVTLGESLMLWQWSHD